MGLDKLPMTNKKAKFLEKYSELDDSGILKEILYAHSLQIEKLEKMRSNISILTWWIVGIPILIFLFLLLFGGLGALL
jgi:hypothetical protein